jgi:hypothetical protein
MFESLQPASYGISFTFFVLTLTTCVLRLYSRAFYVREFGWDDGFMLAVTVLSICAPCSLYGVSDRHLADCHPCPASHIYTIHCIWWWIVSSDTIFLVCAQPGI